MGLKDLVPDGAGDAKGGRPEEKGIETREMGWRTFCDDRDTEEWWNKLIKDVLGFKGVPDEEGEELREALEELAEESHIPVLEVRTKLHEHGIYETDWEHYLAVHPQQMGRRALPDEWRDKTVAADYNHKDAVKVSSGEREPYHDELEEVMAESRDIATGGRTVISGSLDKSNSSGLKSLVDNAKD